MIDFHSLTMDERVSKARKDL
ncbi:MAG: hypothetical protein K0R18_1598, partial [Bacillales bacterium]|nr:hypothetical protein [Bacillales bacterium]